MRRNTRGQKPDIFLNAGVPNFARHSPAECHLADSLFANGNILLRISIKLPITDVLNISVLPRTGSIFIDLMFDFPLTLRPPLDDGQFGELDLKLRANDLFP